MAKEKRVIALDCETDPFRHGRIPRPFLWGAYDGEEFRTWRETADCAAWIKAQKNSIVYAHNGGKFDFIYLLPYLAEDQALKFIGGRIAECRFGDAILRDSYSIIPAPLSDIHKDKIDYAVMEPETRETHMSEIIDYLRTDVMVLHALTTTFRTEVGDAVTIASNALRSSKRLGIDPGRTNFRHDQRFRPFYFGGRTECRQFGTFEDVAVYDIRSSYPHAMSHDHPTGSQAETYRHPDDLDPAALGRAFVELTCDSAGAFPRRGENGSIEFPHERGRYYVTGWEYETARKHGLIRNAEFHRVEAFEGSINFSDYVRKWFEHKERNRPRETLDQRVQYVIGKILLNSLYGKMSMNPLRYYDWRIVEPGTPVDRANGWADYVHFQDREIHRRSVQWDLEFKFGKSWEKKPIYYNVATGASITGFARASLLDAIHTVGADRVIYCDTDSIVIKGYEEPAGLDLSNRLGAWDCEGEFQIGHFAGKKLYGLKSRYRDDKSGDYKYKIACKGSKLNFEEIFRIVRGETVTWRSDAPTFNLARGGSIDDVDNSRFFVERRIRATHPASRVSP